LKFIDSHCHLDRLDLGDAATPDIYASRLAAALEEARGRGVDGFLCVDIDLDNFEAVRAVADAHDDVWCSVGVHPLGEDEFSIDPSVDTLIQLAGSSEKVVAIGECGLDYFKGQGNRQDQLNRFETQLIAACELGLPVIVHSREAREDTLRLLKAYVGQGLRGVLHCFTDTLEMAQAAVDFGFYVSFSGIITFKNAADLRATVKALPLSNLLIETDSPYLAPMPYRGKSNQPKWVVEVAHCMAEVKGVAPAVIAEQTRNNFFELFDRAIPVN
tara:strand:+ start:53488 stop:54303 length:816 start_codon:yes stop_codon:yes gene_type:complete